MEQLTKEQAIDIVRDAGFGFFSTVEGNKPHVRPMMPFLTDDGELLLALLGRSRTINDIKGNPNVEICFVDRKMWYCRVAGTAKLSDDLAKKEIVFENVPMLRQYFAGPEDPNYFLAVVTITSVEAMTPHSRHPEQITL
jgi:general stress protein 26